MSQLFRQDKSESVVSDSRYVDNNSVMYCVCIFSFITL